MEPLQLLHHLAERLAEVEARLAALEARVEADRRERVRKPPVRRFKRGDVLF